MKKIVRIAALLLALCVVLSGCGGNPDGDTTTTTGGDTTTTTTTDSKASGTVLDLTSYFNKDAFSFCANPSDGNFDDLQSEGVACYRADKLSNALAYEDVAYQLGTFDDGKNNCISCEGQTVTVENPAACSFVGVLGAAACGDYGGDFKVTYTDGSSEDVFVYMIDWCDITADYVVATADHRHQNTKGDWEEVTENNRVQYPCYISLYKLEVDTEKQVKSITFPSEKNMNVFAITLAE